MIDIQLQGLELVRKRLKAVPGASEWAIMKIVNDVAVSGRDAAVSDIKERYNITDRPVRNLIRIINANRVKEVAVIRFSGARFPLQRFAPQQTPGGVTIEEVRGQRSAPIAHIFKAVMLYGPSVFARVGSARGPVHAVTGLAVANMAREETKVLPDTMKRIEERVTARAPFWIKEALRADRVEHYGS
jgi:hypothetical protein